MKFIVSIFVFWCVAQTSLAVTPGQISGVWNCEESIKHVSGRRQDDHFWGYQLQLGSQGQFQLGGYYYNYILGYQVPLSGQGTWQPANNGAPKVYLSGYRQRQDSAQGEQINLALTVADGSNMYMNFQGATGLWLVQCQR